MSLSDFKQDQEDFIRVGNQTVFIETDIQLEDGSTRNGCGTGFFVSAKLILTAAHVVVAEEGKVTGIRINYAGAKTVDASANTLECELVEVMRKIDHIDD